MLAGKVICEPSNDKLYKFEGTISIDGHVHALDINCICVRGSSLRNTEWIYGLVVYTGHDTKIMRNSSAAKSKFSNLEKQTNKQIILVFLFQIIICIFGAACNIIWEDTYGKVSDAYLHFGMGAESDPVVDMIIRFGTWLLLFS